MGSIIFSAYTIGWPFVSYNSAWSTPEEINLSFIKLAAFLTSLLKFLSALTDGIRNKSSNSSRNLSLWAFKYNKGVIEKFY